MSKIGKKIPCRSCHAEAMLMISKKIVRLEMFDEVRVKQSFENLRNSRSEINRVIVGEVGAVTLLRNRLNKCMFPRRRMSSGNKNEAKKMTKNRRQFISKFPQKSVGECPQVLKPCLFLKNEAPSKLMSRDNDGGYRVREGLNRRISSFGITERRISEKVRAKEIGFISRRTSYTAIRVNN